jgi:hypothetical protein
MQVALMTQTCRQITSCCHVVSAGTHDILKPYSSDGMAAQLYFTADAPDSRFFQSWDLDLVFDVLQVCYVNVLHCYIAVLLYMVEAVYQTRELLV